MEIVLSYVEEIIDPYLIVNENVLTNRGLWLSSQAQQALMYMNTLLNIFYFSDIISFKV
ncbi:hypothetical protein RhiirA1_468152 [Rhizophagus irregularis]|uniref:Uncharacterized protein n=1 Tax=Rhizophagus irregularis TaxID=588596 RepID=A0A2I1F3T4_9GLOM|nr:hypothetical protein RhiirA1_468152 [Rhizophagus irregularis]PKY29033.1 hypothetical protein RhiirB3_445482 [Rhizophagus irregularis]